MSNAEASSPAASVSRDEIPGQVVLVLQGGGALGAYQLGVYQALHESGLQPDWVIGTSIGAINAAIIAGNPIEQRWPRLQRFWEGVAVFGIRDHGPAAWFWDSLNNLRTLALGVPGFFEPNPVAALGPMAQVGIEQASYYGTGGLRNTLNRLVDFDQLGHVGTRLTVGAVSARSGAMRYFDSRAGQLTPDHILASGALPPAFPAIRIDDEPYWDGGIFSNTPVEAVLDDMPRRDSVIFSVNLWNPSGPEPRSLWEVQSRQKEIQYASRFDSHLMRQAQIHRLRHVIREFEMLMPPELRASESCRALAAWGCSTVMHVVRLTAPRLINDDLTRDIDFTRDGIEHRRQAGYRDTLHAVRKAPWRHHGGILDGVVVHDVDSEDTHGPAGGAGTAQALGG
ncbi:MAG TPA: patatin-like phospholipase family protein [Burkholderiaceae bacterium]|nr:patatin-like phospholipase family protein [Burkholderiaceae bacterium]